MTIINAFHKDFLDTHMPGFMNTFRTQDARRQAAEALSGYVTHKRKTKPSHGTVTGISKAQRETVQNQKFQDISAFPKTRESRSSLLLGSSMSIAEIAKELTLKKQQRLAPKEFHTFSKAGTANTTKVKKKSK